MATGVARSEGPLIWRALERVNQVRYFHHIFCFKNTGFRTLSEEFYRHILRSLHAEVSDAGIL
jgi:bacterioferritin (cytochrome b1)